MADNELEAIRKRWPSKSVVKRQVAQNPSRLITQAWNDIRYLLDYIEKLEDFPDFTELRRDPEMLKKDEERREYLDTLLESFPSDKYDEVTRVKDPEDE